MKSSISFDSSEPCWPKTVFELIDDFGGQRIILDHFFEIDRAISSNPLIIINIKFGYLSKSKYKRLSAQHWEVGNEVGS